MEVRVENINIKEIENIKRIQNKLINENVYLKAKRIIDITISIIILLLTWPLLIIIAIAIKIDSKGPVIFKHERIGQNGKKIKVYKFRTMVNNAEELINKFTPQQKEEWEEYYKLKNDPRITRVGKILRSTCLDELPQIINILKGELSIVGPRPITLKELEKYGEQKEKFTSVKPGITGYWQINGKNDVIYNERIKLELYYVENMSFKLDVKILFKTIGLILKGKFYEV